MDKNRVVALAEELRTLEVAAAAADAAKLDAELRLQEATDAALTISRARNAGRNALIEAIKPVDLLSFEKPGMA